MSKWVNGDRDNIFTSLRRSLRRHHYGGKASVSSRPPYLRYGGHYGGKASVSSTPSLLYKMNWHSFWHTPPAIFEFLSGRAKCREPKAYTLGSCFCWRTGIRTPIAGTKSQSPTIRRSAIIYFCVAIIA